MEVILVIVSSFAYLSSPSSYVPRGAVRRGWRDLQWKKEIWWFCKRAISKSRRERDQGQKSNPNRKKGNAELVSILNGFHHFQYLPELTRTALSWEDWSLFKLNSERGRKRCLMGKWGGEVFTTHRVRVAIYFFYALSRHSSNCHLLNDHLDLSRYYYLYFGIVGGLISFKPYKMQ